MTIPTESADCDALRAEIVALLDNELEPGVAEAVRAHIKACAACAAFQAETSRLLEVTRAAFPMPAPPDLAQRMIAAIPSSRPPTDSDLLWTELRSVRAEMQAMRSEIDDLRRQLAARDSLAGQPPPRPVSRLAFPYAAPPDIRRREA